MPRKAEHPASINLRGIVQMIDGAGSKRVIDPLLVQIRKLSVEAIEVLLQNDPLLEALATPLLVLRRCTSVTTKTTRGKTIDRVSIIDPTGYGWAMAQIHKLGDV